MQQSGVVDLGIMGEGDEGGVAVDAEWGQGGVRPFGDHLHLGKALGAGKGGARVDDRHVIADERRHRRQRLADMHRPGDHQLRRRHEHVEENAAFRRVRHAALAAAQARFQCFAQRIAGNGCSGHEALRAAGKISDDDGRAPRRPLGIQGMEDVEFHFAFPRRFGFGLFVAVRSRATLSSPAERGRGTAHRRQA